MLLDNNDKKLLIQSLSELQNLKIIFYEILNKYSTLFLGIQ